MKKFALFHDYGPEGWKIVGEFDSIVPAVLARENDVTSGGGTSIIVEVIPVLIAYSRAQYDSSRASG